ncbi:DUF7673 family protein [Hydrogenophaga sp.]|uniref:DUF7673 family protein n=1 Tax=Hydrogenophaga sp. TaxID=1904254 RepID=UPI003D0A9EA3
MAAYNPTQEQIDALVHLWLMGQRYSSSEKAAANLLLGLYNGLRFPFDLTDLRLFDDSNLRRALLVLEMDARPKAEVHVLLAHALGEERGTMGLRFEYRALDLRLKRAAKKADLAPRPAPMRSLEEGLS